MLGNLEETDGALGQTEPGMDEEDSDDKDEQEGETRHGDEASAESPVNSTGKDTGSKIDSTHESASLANTHEEETLLL